jgi:hypothetical protein
MGLWNLAMMLKIKNHFALSTVLAIFMFSACGSHSTTTTSTSTSVGSGQPDLGGLGHGSAGVSFECSGKICNSATEYCLVTGMGEETVPNTVQCVKKPASFDETCESAENNARAQFPTTNNCSNFISCANSQGEISIYCTVPSRIQR